MIDFDLNIKISLILTFDLNITISLILTISIFMINLNDILS